MNGWFFQVIYLSFLGFHEWGISRNGWFITEKSIYEWMMFEATHHVRKTTPLGVAQQSELEDFGKYIYWNGCGVATQNWNLEYQNIYWINQNGYWIVHDISGDTPQLGRRIIHLRSHHNFYPDLWWCPHICLLIQLKHALIMFNILIRDFQKQYQ